MPYNMDESYWDMHSVDPISLDHLCMETVWGRKTLLPCPFILEGHAK